MHGSTDRVRTLSPSLHRSVTLLHRTLSHSVHLRPGVVDVPRRVKSAPPMAWAERKQHLPYGMTKTPAGRQESQAWPPPFKAPPPQRPGVSKATLGKIVCQAKGWASGEILRDPRHDRPWEIEVDFTHTTQMVKIALERDFNRACAIIDTESDKELELQSNFLAACKPDPEGGPRVMTVYFWPHPPAWRNAAWRNGQPYVRAAPPS